MTNQETDNFNVYKSDVAFMLISPFILVMIYVIIHNKYE